MKTINQYRATNTYLVGSQAVKDLVAINAQYAKTLVSVGHDAKRHDQHDYIIRVSDHRAGLVDVNLHVDCLGKVSVIHHVPIMTWGTTAQVDALVQGRPVPDAPHVG